MFGKKSTLSTFRKSVAKGCNGVKVILVIVYIYEKYTYYKITQKN